tara:strand:+ start:128 stop:874 length:747 start_codon:yes stop_codon:yes gene_type:complete
MGKLIIDKELTEPTLKWIRNGKNRDSYLNSGGENERFFNFSKQEENFINGLGLDYTSVEIIGQIILSHYGLDLETPTNPYFNNRISWYSKGSEEKPSRSDNLKGKIAVRFNVMLQKPKIGGLPNKVNEVGLEVRGVQKYGFVPVEGVKSMVLLSIEYHVDEDVAKLKGWMHPNCKPIESSPVWNKNNNYNEDKYYPYLNTNTNTQLPNEAVQDMETLILDFVTLNDEYCSAGIDPIRKKYIAKKLGYV